MCRFTPIFLTFTKVHFHRLQEKTFIETFTAKNITFRRINLCQKICFRLPGGLILRDKPSTSFHWNIMNNWKAAYWLIGSWEIWVQSWQPFLKNSWKKGGNFAVLLQLFPFASIASYNFSLSFAFAGIPPNIQNLDIIVQHKFKHFRDRVSKISVP